MIIVKAPLRISFVGGGSDIANFYNVSPGATLSATIDKYVYICINHSFEGHIRLGYSKTEVVSHSDDLEHSRVREALNLLGLHKGLEIISIADVPSKGTGLGSSSSFTVALLKALHQHIKKDISAVELAELACRIEIEKIKEPIGKQDQYISSLGGLKFMEYLPGGQVLVSDVACNSEVLKQLEDSLLMFYTGKSRSATDILTEQISGYAEQEKIEVLKKMVKQAHALKESLTAGDLSSFGNILDEGWKLKKSLSHKISNSEIDLLYDTAIKNGALGGKLLGAGGGGFLLFYVPMEKQSAVRKALSHLQEMIFKFEPVGATVMSVDGKHLN